MRLSSRFYVREIFEMMENIGRLPEMAVRREENHIGNGGIAK